MNKINNEVDNIEVTMNTSEDEAVSPSKQTFKIGDKVVPIRLVSYSGTPLKQYDDYYIITSLSGNSAILMARGQIWASMNINDLRHY